MDTETLIYAIIAIAVFARLWAVLGRRNDNDPQRPNPFSAPPSSTRADDETATASMLGEDQTPVLRPLRLAPDSLAGGLEQIKAQSPAFDEKQFLQGARAAFTIILEDFTRGDLSRATRLLGPQVLARFQRAIEQRRQAGQTLENKIVRLRDVETAAARLNGATANVTVRFVSEQENILRDAAGQIISGTPGHAEEITDLWTFARDTASTDPNWLLIETKS